VSELLDLSSIETGQFDLHPEAVALELLIDDCVTTVGPAARAGAVTLEKKIAPQLPHVFADPRAVKQMTHNLLSNAIKFTGPGGAVRVFAAIAPSGELALGVSDTGVGIAEADQAYAFDRFGQARHDVANSENGAGLGLPIVKGLAEAHGGRVTLESRLGHGTTVTVWFPAHCVQPGAEDLDNVRAAG
jgi:two-component system cell cycle sensor histidine kinase PleC